jgi:hypothetical protein
MDGRGEGGVVEEGGESGGGRRAGGSSTTLSHILYCSGPGSAPEPSL